MSNKMRYQVLEQSKSCHCCFEATVVDTSISEREEAYNVCETFSVAQAQLIADALNKAVQ